MPTFRLTLEYDGAAFEGWQSQPGEEHPTVQDALRQALERVTGGPARVTGSGRTDTGVHAEGQVASIRAETGMSARALGRALNGVLPRSVAVLACEPAAEDFDARRAARSKRYRYQIWNGPVRSPLRAARFAWEARPLDVEAMGEAAFGLLGEHDFACFQAAGSSVGHSVRSLTRAEVSGHPGGEIFVVLEGSGFLRHMVRNVAGTLIEVGLGRRSAADLPDLLASRDRGQAGPTAPSQGLTLVSVDYRDGAGGAASAMRRKGEHSSGKSVS